jgi:hypothetical protein
MDIIWHHVLLSGDTAAVQLFSEADTTATTEKYMPTNDESLHSHFLGEANLDTFPHKHNSHARLRALQTARRSLFRI